MAPHPHPRPNIVGLLPTFMIIGFVAFVSVLKAPFRGKNGATTARKSIAYAALREILSRLSESETQGLTATTEAVYKSEARKIKWKPDTVDVGEGVKGHWMGNPDAKYVMIFFHGGGYIGYASPGHLKYQFALQAAVNAAGHDLAIFSVSYTLAPHQAYPYQLNQAVQVLNYLLDIKKRDPSTILIGGDSAGGNLTSALTLHLARPHPSVPAVHLARKLRGILLISPWIQFDYTAAPFRDNAASDYLTVAALQRASGAFVGPAGQRDAYNEPVRADAGWWTDVANRVVDEVMVWGGGGEVLIDSIRTIAGTIAEGFARADAAGTAAATPETGGKEFSAGVGSEKRSEERKRTGRERVFFVETPRAAHEEQIMDRSLRIKEKGASTTVIEEWVTSRL